VEKNLLHFVLEGRPLYNFGGSTVVIIIIFFTQVVKIPGVKNKKK